MFQSVIDDSIFNQNISRHQGRVDSILDIVWIQLDSLICRIGIFNYFAFLQHIFFRCCRVCSATEVIKPTDPAENDRVDFYP